ncbi:MaoC family dehydratase [Oceanibacterium hippocampi]|uniref:Bifunctional protein PaaZ n=1 Tax=Oceanibacterium hippocampi TaxID=745714 RepID=A0A1Y5R7E4_9PROT|nr:MaoC family dehydratase [Oceanibacterium hippocampi]SLN10247.1 Bifunctional protein PaaZ [Oceanibacterium hippocampi]
MNGERYYEDYAVGLCFRANGVTVTEAQIIEFACLYDPQPFHMDRVAAESSIYGGLIASGVMVMGLGLRMLVQAGALTPTSMGSPGIDRVRWHRPVRPGDTLYGVATVTETRASRSRPDLGLVTMDFEILNQSDEIAMRWTGTQLIARRPTDAATAS